MSVKNERFSLGDVYMWYEYEQVFFRFDFESKRFFRRFSGNNEEAEVPFNNGLLNEAICGGVEINRDKYMMGA
jgi:hypothetical protein